jgi:hypothetical protein
MPLSNKAWERGTSICVGSYIEYRRFEEELPSRSEAMISIVMTRLMIRRLAAS